MSASISTAIKSAGTRLVAAMLTATLAKAGSAYLPITGPTPLRFEVVKVRSAMILPASVAAADSEKAREKSLIAPPALIGDLQQPVTNSVSGTQASPADKADNSATDSFGAHSPAENLLIITPQMLSEYFKPFGCATNVAGVSVFVPVPVGFTPPTDKNNATSRATYKVQ